MTQFKVT